MNVEFVTSDPDVGPILSITADERSSYLSLIEVCEMLKDGRVEIVDLTTVFPSQNWAVRGLLFARSDHDIGVKTEHEGFMEIHLTSATWVEIIIKLENFLRLDLKGGDYFNWLAGPQSDNTPTRSHITLLISTKGGW